MSGYRGQEVRLRAGILQQFPKINIGFLRAGDNTNVITTGFGVTIDLPLFDRNQGAIAVEDATRASSLTNMWPGSLKRAARSRVFCGYEIVAAPD